VFGIGTDSNVSIGVADELRQLEYSQRCATAPATSSAPPMRVRLAACCSKAQSGAVRRPSESVRRPALRTGRGRFRVVEPGRAALSCRNGDALLDSLIFAGGAGCIDGVWRAGRKFVSEGRHLERDQIARAYQATLRRLLG